MSNEASWGQLNSGLCASVPPTYHIFGDLVTKTSFDILRCLRWPKVLTRADSAATHPQLSRGGGGEKMTVNASLEWLWSKFRMCSAIIEADITEA